jgi:Flp pilus assembly protein TadG
MMIKVIFAHPKKRAVRLMLRAGRYRSQRGQSAVEIALLLPILLLILFGIIIAGFIFYAHIQVSNAVREGARAGSVYWVTHPINSLNLQDTVSKAIYDSTTTPPKSALGVLPVTSSNLSVVVEHSVPFANSAKVPPCTDASPCAGDMVMATIIYSYTMPVVSVMVPMFQQPFVMRSSVVMEIQ